MLSCRKKAARCSVLLKILLSLKATQGHLNLHGVPISIPLSLSCTVSDILCVEQCALEIWIMGRSR